MIVVHRNKSNFHSINETGIQNMMDNSFYAGKNIPMTWAAVRAIDKDTGTVTVQTDRGYMIPGVRVCVFGSYNHANKQGYSGTKIYPEIDSVVLVAFPSDGVPVTLGSAFFMESSNDKDKLIDADDVNIERTIKTAGWNIAYDNAKGSIEIKDDNYIKDDDQKKKDAEDFVLSFDKEKHAFNLVWWKKKLNFAIDDKGGFTFSLHSGDDSDNELFTVSVADDGSKVETCLQKDNVKTLSTTEPGRQTIEVGGNKITIDGSTSGAEKIEVTDGKSTITLDATQGTFSVADGNNNTIESSSSGLTIASAMNGKIALGTTVDIKSAVGSLADKLNELWGCVSDLAQSCLTHSHPGSTSSGAPAAHTCTIVPDAGSFASSFAQIQAKQKLVSLVTQ